MRWDQYDSFRGDSVSLMVKDLKRAYGENRTG
jgi:hypothetical protein